MESRQLAVGGSAWPRRLCWGLLGLALMSACCAPADVPWLMQLSWLPGFYLCAAAVPKPALGMVVSLQPDIQLRWYGDAAYAMPKVVTGQLLASSQICWLGVWLRWQTAEGQSGRCWIFRDALSEADFRTLARTLVQLRWQHSGQMPSGLLQWFS